jgi:hypothetical protein
MINTKLEFLVCSFHEPEGSDAEDDGQENKSGDVC